MGSEEQLRRENAELLARAEHDRAELQRHLDLSKRLREYAAHLRATLREQMQRGAGAVFAEVAAVSAVALDVERVSVWLLDARRQVLACKYLWERGVGARATSEIPLGAVQRYVRALTTDLVAADDVSLDLRLLELRGYCAERGVGALIDVPVVVDGEVLGVVCHEHIGGVRAWRDAEIDFAANLGSVVALAIEVERRHEAQDRAQEATTAERTAEQRRREAERRYRELLDHVDLIGVVLDARGVIVAVNGAFALAAGVSREAAIGADFVARFVPEAERAGVRRLLTDGIRARALPPRVEISLLTADGALRSIVWSTTLQFDPTGAVTGTASLGLDLTERLRLEAELAQQRKFESLGRMAAGVAHDFNNVLTVISLAQAHGGKDSEIGAAMAYARELVASLLSYARREPVAVQDVDVDAAIGELGPVLATAIGKDLHLDLALGAGGGRVRIAPTELRQLIVNMVTNAGEAARGHGRTVRVATDAVADAAARRCVELRIVDDGRGMDEATRARVFDPFFTTKQPGEGTGIGLATCQSIVSRAGGTITVESKLGKGTAFRILLPVRVRTGEIAVVRPPSADPIPGHRVLIVEDSQAIGDLMMHVLQFAGHEVVHVTRLAQALAVLASEDFDVVIADLQLPDGRGEDVVAAARARSDQTAIIVASGEPTVILGVDAVLLKPFSNDDLKAGIRRALTHRRDAR
jgi:PAS domain S-box-containing protein